MIGKGTLPCLGATERYIEFIILSCIYMDVRANRQFFRWVRWNTMNATLVLSCLSIEDQPNSLSAGVVCSYFLQ